MTTICVSSTYLLILREGKLLFSSKFSNQVNKILSALLHGKLMLQGEVKHAQLKVRSKVRHYL